MKIVVTLLVIVGAVYGLYNFTMAAYGWFEVGGIVDEVGKAEAGKVATASQSGFGVIEARDRFGRVRELIVKGAKDVDVELKPENVQVGLVDNMLDIRVSWDAPMARYRGKTYLEIPLSIQRVFPLTRPG
jgi:hypothetical protein